MSEIGERTSLAPEHDVATPFAGTRIMHNFRLVGIDHEQFEPLFRLSDAQLKERGVVRRIATESPGFPCRISLEDADVGDELLLVPYRHQPAASPYRASGPIYIRRGARQATLAADEVPTCVSGRLMSVRAYDAEHMIVAAEVCEGSAVAPEIRRLFADDRVAYLHLHNAKQGCFSCRVDRA
jgi:hypothetical protein